VAGKSTAVSHDMLNDSEQDHVVGLSGACTTRSFTSSGCALRVVPSGPALFFPLRFIVFSSSVTCPLDRRSPC